MNKKFFEKYSNIKIIESSSDRIKKLMQKCIKENKKEFAELLIYDMKDKKLSIIENLNKFS